jgi:hypothetical protein
MERKRKGFRVEPEVMITRRPSRTLKKKIKVGSIAWKILNYVVNEPGVWTVPEIAKDLEDKPKYYGSIKRELVDAGYIINKDAMGRYGAHRLIATQAGAEAFMRAE